MHNLLKLTTTSSTPHAIDLNAGDGSRLSLLAHIVGVSQDRTWGITDDPGEAEAAGHILGHVIHAEPTGARLAYAGASLAIADNAMHSVLAATHALIDGGVIVVMPRNKSIKILGLVTDSFGAEKQAFIRHMTGSFTQVYEIDSLKLVIGVKRESFSNAHVGWRIDRKTEAELAGRYLLASSPGFARGFTKAKPTKAEVAAAVKAMTATEAKREIEEAASPIMPLSPGHLGMVLASGMLDGLITLANGETVVIRGIANKEKYQVSQEVSESDGGVRTRKTVYSEKASLKIRTINQAGDVIEYVQGD